MVMTIIYEFMVFALAALFVWNLFAVKDGWKKISSGIVLLPLLLRLFMIR